MTRKQRYKVSSLYRLKLRLELLEPRRLLIAEPIISEFMASNRGALDDGEGASPDWIEIMNSGDNDVDLAGYRLTNDPQNLSQWVFPSVNLGAGEYLLVFASGQETEHHIDAAGNLHTNFRLDRDGDYLGLVAPDETIVSQFGSVDVDFPEQLPNVSYGIAQLPDARVEQKVGYQSISTPGTQNLTSAEVFVGFVEDTEFSIDRGFYKTTQTVEVTTQTHGATIVYTTDGSLPTRANGVTVAASSPPSPASATVLVKTTTTLRAAAFKPDHLPSKVDTHTYVFVEDVIRQNNTPVGFPTEWKSNAQFQKADYEMDPEITNNPAYRDLMDDALLAIPTISIVTDSDNLFDLETGIYMNPENHGVEWERPASVELIYPDGKEGFQEDAGLRIQGGASRRPGLSPKHSFRLLFKNIYGDAKLRFPLFGEEAITEFDTVILRAGFNQSWIHTNEFQGDNRGRAQFIRDQWAKNTQRAMGHVAPHNNYAHVYLNGVYWGLYNPTERPSATFAADYFGGDKDDYDVINSGRTVDGDLEAFHKMFDMANAGLAGDAEYQAFAEILDIDAFIDYMILNQYGGNLDWDSHNWYVIRRREPGGKFYWIAWDSEFIFIDNDHNVLEFDRAAGGRGPGRLFNKLIENEQFRNRFADRVTRHYFGDGALTTENVIERWEALSDQVIDAVIAESARWGDYRRDVDRGLPPLFLYERDVQWMSERNRLLHDYFPNRGQIVLQQYIEAGLYTDIPVVTFNQDGGPIDSGFELSMSVPSGEIYYTLDGTDPKVNEPTTALTTLLAESSPVQVLVPGDGSLGTDWVAPEFDDSAWNAGLTGVGYETRTGFENLIGHDVQAEMFHHASSVYLRLPFEVTDLAAIHLLWLNMKYDDGFVAYLNGVEAARRNAPDSLSWDSAATDARSDRKAREFENINISAFLHLLTLGDNVLSIHGLNTNSRNDDFLIAPELVGGAVTDTGASASAFRYEIPVPITQDTIVTARTLLGGQWSTINEAEFFVEETEGLRVSEIMYHPSDPTANEIAGGFTDANDFEFLELTNVGKTELDLSSIQLSDAVVFDFADSAIRLLAPGQSVVVARNEKAFRVRYGSDPSVAGQYQGRLANGGEMITVSTAMGEVIQQFAYLDDWYPDTDGLGFSLEIVEPNNPDLEIWSQKDAWRRGGRPGGSPGSVYDAPAFLPGDANRNGTFNQQDLILTLQIAKFLVDEPAVWEEGDWTGDGRFDQLDVVLALQSGFYNPN